VLKIEGLSIAFRTAEGLRPAVTDMSFEIAPGEILGLVGESGSGKTLMSLAVMGLLPPNAVVTAGRVLDQGTDLLGLPPEALRRRRGAEISMIFQDPIASLDPLYRCGDQVIEAILLHEPIGRRAARARALELFERVRLPDPARAMRAYPHELSGGQCQRVMIAMAIVCRPRIIIADEPTTALDVTVQRQVLDLLRELNREVGAAILLITHDLGVIAQTADRVAVMYQGRMVEEARTADLFARPQQPYTRGLIGAMPQGRQAPGQGLTTVAAAAAGTTRAIALRTPPDPSAPPLLEIRDLDKSYRVPGGLVPGARTVRAVDGVSLSIWPRETLGLVGESGCGKTTLSRLIMRLSEPDSGQMLFAGRDITHLSPKAMVPLRREISMVFQNPYGSLNPRQTVEELVGAPLIIHGEGDAASRQARVARLVEHVGLPRAALSRYPHEFSGGQRQRIVIARALALNPRLVICDEAVSALDLSVQAQVLNLLADLQAEHDLAYLFISHDLSVVEHVSDRIAVMQKGRIVETGPAEAIFAAPRDPYTRALLSAVPRIPGQSARSEETAR
jgi:peptide/nickel transport system ATP-binding protein